MYEDLRDEQLQSLIYNREAQIAGLCDQINAYSSRMSTFPPDARASYTFAISKLQSTVDAIEATRRSMQEELRKRQIHVR